MENKDIFSEFKKGFNMTEKEWKEKHKPYSASEEEDTSLLDMLGLKKKDNENDWESWGIHSVPNKRVDNLKNETERSIAQGWQKSLKLKNMTTREWDIAANERANGKQDSEIRKTILQMRKKK